MASAATTRRCHPPFRDRPPLEKTTPAPYCPVIISPYPGARPAPRAGGFVEHGVAVVVPFEKDKASIEHWSVPRRPTWKRVNAMIISRTGSEVTMIPEVANHLISSGGKRLRPMLTLARRPWPVTAARAT